LAPLDSEEEEEAWQLIETTVAEEEAEEVAMCSHNRRDWRKV